MMIAPDVAWNVIYVVSATIVCLTAWWACSNFIVKKPEKKIPESKEPVNQMLAPVLRITEQSGHDNSDGTYTVDYQTRVEAAFSPGLLTIQIQAPGLIRVDIMPPAVNGAITMSLRNKRIMGDQFHAEIPSPFGQYKISVRTEKRADIRLDAMF